MKTMKTFIHISDLHIAEMYRPGIEGKNKRTEKTWLIAQSDKDNHDYIAVFCDSVKEQFKDTKRDYYLLITGDIADSSSELEYKYAKVFLDQIVKELKIDKTKVLIVPGNHDVYRPLCRIAADKDPEKPAYLQLEAKYSNFKCFYDGFYKEVGKTFESDKQIVDHLALKDEKLLFVGINTNYKIDYEDGDGAVDIDAFKKELSELCEKYEDYSKIAIFHHNMLSDSDENSSPYGSWDKDDWLSFKGALERMQFKILMFGNEHTRASSRNLKIHRGENAMYVSDSGSFALHDETCVPAYKVYELFQDKNKTILKQYLFELGDVGRVGVRKYGRWCKQINAEHDELEEYVLLENKTNPFDQEVKEDLSTGTTVSDSVDTSKEIIETKEVPTETKYVDLESLADTVFHDEMMNIIKLEHLYHPGHFHWGKSSRSHNWIDTISLLNDRRYIDMIQEKIREVVKEIERVRKIKYDVIIGLGMEGNIMSTQLLLDDAAYTYLPYTYRYDDFSEFEKSICFKNNDGKYKNVLIITDVVNKGRMLKNLIVEKDATFFNKVEQIHIVSLFYTGNYDDRKMPVGLKEIENKKIEYYSLMQLEVGECPYGDDFENICTIYKEHLCEVYKFYSEK